MEPLSCSTCHTSLEPTFHYCPNCGKKVTDTLVATDVGKQIGIYLLSFFLPPFGFWPGMKYLRQKNQKAQIIGAVAIILTVFSLGISLWLGISLFANVEKQVNTQLNQLQGF